MKTKAKTVKSGDETLSEEVCKLERLKKAGAYGVVPHVEAWAEGLTAMQREVGCAVARRPKQAKRTRRPRLASGRR